MRRLTPFIMPPFKRPSAFDISFLEEIRPMPEPPNLNALDLTGTRAGKRKNDVYSRRFDKWPWSGFCPIFHSSMPHLIWRTTDNNDWHFEGADLVSSFHSNEEDDGQLEDSEERRNWQFFILLLVF
jgi:hypothetical protein